MQRKKRETKQTKQNRVNTKVTFAGNQISLMPTADGWWMIAIKGIFSAFVSLKTSCIVLSAAKASGAFESIGIRKQTIRSTLTIKN
jgi:hypothetical protein